MRMQSTSLEADFEKFLAFEDKGQVLTYHYAFHNMLMWPFIRNVVWNSIWKSNFGEEMGLIDNTAENMKHGRVLSFKWSQFFKFNKNPLFIRKHIDILCLNHVLGNVKDKDGSYYNRIYDDFLGLHGNMAIIESAPLFRHFYPKKYRTFEADFIEIICAFHEKLAPMNPQDKDTIERFIIYLRKELPFDIREKHWATIRIELERYAKNNRLIYNYYHRIFTRISPKIVFVAQGCDGSHMACKIKALKDLKIPSAEIQHGLINSSHFAYNYSQAVNESQEYREYMPDVFLIFGRFWEQFARVPIEKYILGNANFNRNLDSGNREEGVTEDENSILILPSDTEPYMELIQYVKQKMPEKKLFIKVHPMMVQQYDVLKTMEDARTLVNISGNINDFFSRVKTVVGDDSTALYEAAALGKRVMIWKSKRSEWISTRIGTWFQNKEELVGLLQGGVDRNAEVSPEDIFARDSRERYLKFISRYVDVNS